MKKSAIIFLAVVFSLAAGCGKTENTDKSKDQNTGDQKLQTSASDKSIEIHASGMTCTGCENTIKDKVKEVDGVKDVTADYKSNLVKASYDPSKTNPEKIKEAIIAAGYKIEHTH
jgi:copper chaperone CopZ